MREFKAKDVIYALLLGGAIGFAAGYAIGFSSAVNWGIEILTSGRYEEILKGLGVIAR